MAYNFTKLVDYNTVDVRNSFSIAASSDGVYIYMAQSLGRFWVSRNSGLTWEEERPAGDFNLRWKTCCSSNGQYVVAASNNWRIYLSSDYGQSWSEIQPFGDNDTAITPSINSSGSNIFVVNYEGRCALSTNYGATWTEVQPRGNVDGDWSYAFIDTVGTKLIAVDSDSPASIKIYRSNNSGATWTDITPKSLTHPYYWGGIWVSTNTLIIYCAVFRLGGTNSTDLNINVSINGGTNWSTILPASLTQFQQGLTISASDDGTTILIFDTYYSKINYSVDSGLNWTELTNTVVGGGNKYTGIWLNSTATLGYVWNYEDYSLYKLSPPVLTIFKNPTGTIKIKQPIEFSQAFV